MTLTRSPRVRALLAVILTTVAIVAASASLDGPMASRAAMLPPSAVAWGWLLSDIGLAAWMFAASAMVAVAGLIVSAASETAHQQARALWVTRCASLVFATLCTESLAVQAIKHLVGRARPYAFATFGAYHFDMLSLTDKLASFPSGHTATAFAMATTLSLLAPRYRVALYTLATGIALSRIVVQAHFVSDILVGSLFGTGAARLTARAFAQHGWVFNGEASRPAAHLERDIPSGLR